jgi:hypothetical protein
MAATTASASWPDDQCTHPETDKWVLKAIVSDHPLAASYTTSADAAYAWPGSRGG